MGTLAVRRRVTKGIQALAPEVTVKIVRARKHVILEIARPGIKPRHLPLASSPNDDAHAIINTINQARKALNLKQPPKGRNEIPSCYRPDHRP